MEEMELKKHSWKLSDSEKDSDANTWVSFCTDLSVPLASFDTATIKHHRNGNVST